MTENSSGANPVDGNIIRNNILDNTGWGTQGSALDFISFFIDDDDDIKNTVIENNLIYLPDKPSPVQWRDSGAITVAAFNALTATQPAGNTDTIAANIQADPLLDSNLAPQAGSPVLNQGQNYGQTTDFNETLLQGQFDIGAVKALLSGGGRHGQGGYRDGYATGNRRGRFD